MKTSLLVFLLSLFTLSTATFAMEGDLRVGTHAGCWGGITCTYEVTSREKGRLVFTGKIHLPSTNEHDNIRIEQYPSGGLGMFRTLSGGQTQWVRTNPAIVDGGRFYFGAMARGGPGMQKTRLTHSFLSMKR